VFNAYEVIRTNPTVKKFQIGDLLFAQFDCPAGDESVGLWTDTDHLLHILTAEMSWKTSKGISSANAGETIYFKKGAYVMPNHSETDLCLQVFFIPDSFVRQVVIELASDLPACSEPGDPRELVFRVNNDVALSAFFQAMNIYFASDEKPPEALLKLKFKELLISILLGQSNLALSRYFRELAAGDSPSIASIMESNFNHNLPLDSFAQMCHRSLSSFKREFQKLYHTTPGKWLLDRRLEHSASLLQTTPMSITEIMFECGFEDLSHFSRTFKKKYGHPPIAYRELNTLVHR
jgi:AraC-like DNA-binding protein